MESLAVIFFACCVSFAEFKPLEWSANANPILLVRLKRTPNRAFTFSGFNPNTGLSAFATSADFLPSYYRYAQSPHPSFPESREESYLPSQGEPSYSYPPLDNPTYTSVEEDRKLPAQNLTPPAETAPSPGYNAPSPLYGPPSPAPPVNVLANSVQGPKKPKKKPNRVPAPIDEEEEEETDAKSRSSSSASFNAWFPIVLGSFPSKPNSESYKDESAAPVQQLKEKSPASTIIANSVSNGKSGIASSHAIYYGGESPLQSYRRG